MRVADISEFYAPTGGVRNHLNTKGRVLREAGHDHLVVAPGKRDLDGPLDSAQGRAVGSARVVQVRGPTLPYDSNYQLLWRLDRVRRAMLAFSPDVVTLNSLYMTTLAVATFPSSFPALRTLFWHADFIDTYLRSRLPSQTPTAIGDALFEPLWALVRKVANGSAATLAASKSQVRKLREHGVERVIYLPFGIDRRMFRAQKRSLAVRAELLRSAPTARLLVGVGRLSGEKRWDVVIEGVQRLELERPVRLVMFGEGPELERLRKMCDPRVVTIAGPERDRQRLAAVMASADAFVHGGAFETYGFSVAEAMASGLPVVVPGSGAVLDLIEPACSETFEPGSAGACTSALARVLGPEFERYRGAALAAADGVLDSSQQILEMVRIYQELLAERARSSCQSLRT